jgi:M6 family metalloprotease-like protein
MPNRIFIRLAMILALLPLFIGERGHDAISDALMVDKSMLEVVWPRKMNPIHMVVVFTKFKGELPEITSPPSWASTIFDGSPTSVNHYFDTVSFGQVKVTGEVLPTVYEMPRMKEYYGSFQYGFTQYSEDALQVIDNDRTINFAHFDNDGPDGVPGSRDDDGYVDYMVLVPITIPYNFISGNATGVATLALTYSNMLFTSLDSDSLGRTIKADTYSGCITTGQNERIVKGSICHEYMHSLGAVDLYDTSSSDEETESAGIGFWDIMSLGTMGWNWAGIQMTPSAFTRAKLGWAGINNEKLITIYGIQKNIKITDVSQPGGRVYRIGVLNNQSEYFLVEFRRNDNGNPYDQQMPTGGLFIWHVLDWSTISNAREEMKRCDLESPDGLYEDAGYPLGLVKNPDGGRDNLDFWSKASWYVNLHAGNTGDATDAFDGVRYRTFGPYTNPNSNSAINEDETGVEIYNIRREGDHMLFDVNTAPFIDFTQFSYPLIGTAFNRFNSIFDPEKKVSKPTAYLVSYQNSQKIDELVVVTPKGFAQEDTSGKDPSEIQSLIEHYLLGGTMETVSGFLIRTNMEPSFYSDEMAGYGITASDLQTEKTPVFVQKVYLDSTIEDSQPMEIHLYQNYPNPFNAETMITYTMTKPQTVKIDLYSIIGQRIRSIDQGYREAGTYQYRFSADGLSSGVYLFRITGETISETRKLVYLR